MELNNKTISKGFIISGLINLSVLIFSKFFTNAVLTEFDPVVLSNFGVLMIILWGLAYISVAKIYNQVKWLVAVFAIEKLIYGLTWIHWMMNNELGKVFEKDMLAGAFYSIYGINDLFFCLFFLFVFFKISKTAKN